MRRAQPLVPSTVLHATYPHQEPDLDLPDPAAALCGAACADQAITCGDRSCGAIYPNPPLWMAMMGTRPPAASSTPATMVLVPSRPHHHRLDAPIASATAGAVQPPKLWPTRPMRVRSRARSRDAARNSQSRRHPHVRLATRDARCYAVERRPCFTWLSTKAMTWPAPSSMRSKIASDTVSGGLSLNTFAPRPPNSTIKPRWSA